MAEENKKIKVAFLIGKFPAISETFIINQIADLQDRGMSVEIFSFDRGKTDNVSQRFFDYKMGEKTQYLDMPKNVVIRILKAIPKILRIFFIKPESLLKIFDFKKYGADAWNLKLLFFVEPFVGKEFDLVHCHFGKVANKYLTIREIVAPSQKFITTFYGYDVSIVFNQKPADYYDRLKKECSLFFVMSNNMKERIINHGFKSESIRVLPISVDVADYPFKERKLETGETINLLTVARFVEKKGIDDLLRAIAIVKEKTRKKFRMNIVGGGQMEDELKGLAKELKIEDVTDFKGYMKVEDLIKYFLDMHLYVQPSKTSKDGDME
ncbi:MAG: Glycosyl transferase group 1 [Candidatus Falkowbacteria bacterium GW2011_GWC2_38_22]|uniref:Glycosyl transferase group 1 n=1 Tax=Candidatus Falkowbacteria bacterium GW2011_GWE1_38_31 TaxID=1618638 RepID=A0A0G0MZU8_9BACT|nr:MAG: Glycosyl transferase group 1 [Candidatus Falkowbacteria bacterium GW2011_GWF2_38_1205]KKQ61490.1 MAG: Glycosyl transferase group 1 [Candidatus Falkowbacteria bacterium GW2011_GWC2_38_22]KKQ63617.1 MAG: Glycosyl transferase group 1 [Candidatus Falkowbacteria bacterium GW2011_GWF1_38_22]KKQ65769.1 MAG: Glycosyl transferase group 1 [Candidatus Falkowbacteria bacterium GW2011_GWE2_38_254]KKQ70386.1 MAG: Glycosyl transferase group 1 [Candidatus Falkowbacteria bacterium GW2011_GWE1_38_31]KKQ